MKRIFLLVLAIILVFPFYSYGDVDGLCPLPMKYHVENDVSDKNDTPLSGGSLGDALTADRVDDTNIGTDQPHFILEEDKKHDFNLVIEGESGEVEPSSIKKGAADPSTKAKCLTDPWSPEENKFHPHMSDGFQYNMFPCWQFKKGQSKWTGDANWVIDDLSFCYHFDSPTIWGHKGGIGDNSGSGKEGDGGNPKHPGSFKFVVPSVPFNYYLTSALSLTWEFKFNECVDHYDHTPVCNPTKCGSNCCICKASCSKKQEDHHWKPSPITKQSAQDFWSGCIENPGVATARKGDDNTLDPDGINGTPYTEPSVSFSLQGKPAVVARSSICVHDMKRIANISFGKDGKCEWNGKNGKKISKVDSHSVKFQMIDNCPHMRKQDKGSNMNVTRTYDGDYDEDQFKAIFWYEDIVYDYLSAKNPALSCSKNVDLFYAPKFVLKKGAVWNGLEEFTQNGETKAMADGNEVDINPQYVLFDLEFKTSELFAGSGGEPEDIATFHYAKTSLGDQFGNPRWEDGDYDGEAYDSYEGIASKFKNKPLNMIKGRGPLKCFFEVRQASKRDPAANGAGNEKFNCEEDYFFQDLDKGASKYQEQVAYNPKNVEYIQEPKNATINGGKEVDPTKGNKDQKIEEYKDCADNWKGKHPMLNGKKDDFYQAWGQIKLEDKLRPGVGLRIFNKSSKKYRRIYKKNSIDKLEFYEDMVGNEGSKKETLRNDDFGGKDQYSNDDDEWAFTDEPTDLGQGDEGPDSPQGYGVYEDVELEMSHNDLKNIEHNGSLQCFYAHDNIDGQRMKYSKLISNDYFYKGVEGGDPAVREEYPPSNASVSYANERIDEGYKSWLVMDKTYTERRRLEYYEPDGENFLYPNITFHNPNIKGDGSNLNSGDRNDIYVYYMVHDRAGNTRKFRLKFFVKAIDVNMNILERHDRRY